MDFSKLGRSRQRLLLTDPIEIFGSLPSLANTPNDLWRGQDKALRDWQVVRDKQDVLITLNTGAGKTIVGLLIAQSLVNEGTENVIYVCSTIDLVHQTAIEAERIGIEYTKRVQKKFSNDLFETGNTFCITTYAALFNGHSALRRKHFPKAVIFDDAHVAESLLRDAFTIRIDVRRHEDLFNDIVELFRPHFKELGISGRFEDTLDRSRQSTCFVAPTGLYERRERLLQILRHHGVKDCQEFTYPFAWLEDHLNACAAIFRRGIFELAPPFLPSRALDIFRRPVRRVYLSATLESLADFIRAFGRKPDRVIKPSNDAGNGERLIVDGRKIKKGLGPEFAEKLIRNYKAVIAVPDYDRATPWADLVKPPPRDEFSNALDRFRKADKGAFMLVSRVDGIDLPHETCRIMIVDGLPSGSSLLEKYQWEVLGMSDVNRVRIANRLAQLFGRINRGRNDYGAFLIQGSELSKWLSNDRNLALFPPLLRKQILIAREIQTGFDMRSQSEVIELIEDVLGRDQSWLDYYRREVRMAKLDQEQLKRHEAAEPFLVAAALSEAKYADSMWNGDPKNARRELEKIADETAIHDTLLGGWHAVWLGAAYYLEGDEDAACRAYNIAMQRLGQSMILPHSVSEDGQKASSPNLNPFGWSLHSLLRYNHGNKFENELTKLRQTLGLIDGGKPKQAEAGVRALGELLGYGATRPDKEESTGPDVLWRDEVQRRMIGFELKTDKKAPAIYSKNDIAQGHDHLEWMTQTHAEYDSLGLIYVGPEGSVSDKANPSQQMGLCVIQTMAVLRDRLFALIEDLRDKSPGKRVPAISNVSKSSEWDMEAIVEELWDKSLADTAD